MTIGNSLVQSGYSYQIDQICKNISFPLIAIGTQGTTYLHEGRGGWAWSTFCSSKSPFYVNDSLRFKDYIIANNLSNPDIIRVSLGVNDCYGKSPLESIMIYAKQLIENIHNDYPNSLIIIALPTLCENTGNGWIKSYSNLDRYEDYQVRMRELWKMLYDKYSYGKYNRNVQISFDGLFIDRDNGYPKAEGENGYVHNNGVHPSPFGYAQLARGFSNSLNYYLRDALNANHESICDE